MPSVCSSCFAICVAEMVWAAELGTTLYERLSTAFVWINLLGTRIPGILCWAAARRTRKSSNFFLPNRFSTCYRIKDNIPWVVKKELKNLLVALNKKSKGRIISLPSLPASCSWIFSISIGVVMMTWHMPAPQPANISLKTDKFFLQHSKCFINKTVKGCCMRHSLFPRSS